MDWVAGQLGKAAKAVVEQSLAVKKDEQVAIVCDHKSDMAIVQALLGAVYAVGAEPTVVTMPPRANAGAVATRIVSAALLGADVIIAPTSTGLGFTPEFNVALKERGARAIVMTGVTRELLTAGAGTADYDEVYRITKPLADVMNAGKNLRVTCANGSDFTASIEGMPAGAGASFAREAGQVSSFPSGESWQCPKPGTAEGILFADGSAHMLGRLEQPLGVRFKQGRAVEYVGGHQAEQLRRIIEPIENGDNIGEFSIGTNPEARFEGNITEDKKQIGTAHFALGNSVVGGPVRADIHLDLLMLKPTIEVDGILLVEAGKIVYSG
jgi:leucyl aminopeptidase (aminopeptidase T)